MSTEFAVYRGKEKVETDEDGNITNEILLHWSQFLRVAVRPNSGSMRWTNVLAELLPDETRVYPLDNSAQGIFTIKDIKESIGETNEF